MKSGLPGSEIMSPNKKVIESYFGGKGTEYGRLLADDVELIEWADGVPATGVVTRGKAAYIENRGDGGGHGVQVHRMTEEGNVVIVEGTARGTNPDRGPWTVEFIDIFEVENGKIKRLTSFGVSVKNPA
jgi:uncharacterized protein